MRAMLFLLLPMLLAAIGAPAAAQDAIVVSQGPQAVAVTVYRDPQRGAGGALSIGWLGGFALVTERRQISVPAGAATIRFDGVADGIVPVSAIVTGLPGGTIEKNRDARLLSPAALIDGSLGRHVTLRRTDRATGTVREDDAIVRASGPDGIVLETRGGIEALGCSGLPERPVYAGVPPGLSARPTLSVRTRSARAVQATVTLSYLASEFDWEASYVARIAPDGATLDLFAWLTLANGNDAPFADAESQAVAGTLSRVGGYPRGAEQVPPLSLRCWPQDTTSSAPTIAQPEEMREAFDVVVTGARMPPAIVMMAPAPAPPPVARQEALGDLKLYRLPETVTIAARSQKQVTLLRRARVPFAQLYAFDTDARRAQPPQPGAIRLRMRNVAAAGLGLPLPAGTVALFAGAADGSERLVGGGRLRDSAIGERVELAGGASAQVQLAILYAGGGLWTARLSNANPHAVQAEVRLRSGDAAITYPSAPIAAVDGSPLWAVTVPANGEATLSYRLAEPRAGDAHRPAQRR